MPTRAVVFDLDGTLVDTLGDIAAALNHALRAHHLDALPPATIQALVGDGARVLVERALPPGREALREPVLQAFLARYREHLTDTTRPYAGVLELLEALAARGLRLCVLSNKPDALTRGVVAELLGAGRFALVRGQREGVARKPDPAGALELARELGIPPEEWLYLGDTAVDMETARRAGMVPVGALWGYRGRAELEAAGATRCILSPGELLELLPPPPPQSTPEEERLPGLDVVRGLAVLGIIPANLPHFALPGLADEHAAYVSDAPRELAAFFLQETLVDQKFITTFAFLFGVGLELQAQRAAARGRPFEPGYAARLAVLAVIGLAHALLVWHGDILFHYALIGFAALGLRRLPTAFVGAAAGVCLAIPVTIGALVFVASGRSEQPWDPPRRLAQDRAAADAQPDGAPLAFEGGQVTPASELRAFGRGSYGQQLQARAATWALMVIAVLIIYSWRILGLFLLGVFALRLGLFRQDARWRPVLLALLLGGLLLALPAEAGRAWLMTRGDAPMALDLGLEAGHQCASLLLAAAYLSALLLLQGAAAGRALTAPLGWVGRVALSAYLLQSAIGTCTFYSWGLGWFGRLSRLELLGFAALEAVAVVLLCRLWLRWFRMGPVEWAWRSLAQGELQPLRRLPAAGVARAG